MLTLGETFTASTRHFNIHSPAKVVVASHTEGESIPTKITSEKAMKQHSQPETAPSPWNNTSAVAQYPPV